MTSQEWIAKKPFMSGDELLMCCDLAECEKARDAAEHEENAMLITLNKLNDENEALNTRAEKAEAESAALRLRLEALRSQLALMAIGYTDVDDKVTQTLRDFLADDARAGERPGEGGK